MHAGTPFTLLNVDLYVDSELVTTYSCDGLIVSTPVGSTAHCLSAGGPILRKNLQAFVVLPHQPAHADQSAGGRFGRSAFTRWRSSQPNPGTSVVVDGRVLCDA